MSNYNEQRKEFWRKHFELVRQNKVVEIDLTDTMIATAEKWAKEVVTEKRKEKIHQLDNRNELIRWKTGCLGELALENYLGISIHDEAIGLSHHFNTPDLRESLHLDCGIKSFIAGNFPLTNRIRSAGGALKPDAHPQVFISIDEKRTKAYLYGFASLELLSSNERNGSNNQYVKDKNALKRKTAFTNLEGTQLFKDKEELSHLVRQSTGERLMAQFIF